jgi:hypothetical protein
VITMEEAKRRALQRMARGGVEFETVVDSAERFRAVCVGTDIVARELWKTLSDETLGTLHNLASMPDVRPEEILLGTIVLDFWLGYEFGAARWFEAGE